MKRILFFVCLLAGLQAFAQGERQYDKKSVDTYEKALFRLRDGRIKEAIPDLLEAIRLDPTYPEPQISLANAYGQLKDYANSIIYFEKAFASDSANARYFLWQYANSLAGLGRFDEALTAINRFLLLPNIGDKSTKSALLKKKSYEFALLYAKEHPASNYRFTPANLGDSVNSAKNEYYPSVTIDDGLLVFTRSGNGIREDFMESRYNNKHEYSKAKLIDGNINMEPSKGALAISPDGDWMIFAGNFGNGFGGFDLYITYYTPQGWSDPENLGSNINTEYWESSPSISPDKRVLYFSSNRYGGHGGKDLYMSIRQDNGKFGPAINMGDSINSEQDELAPYIHADNQTLYYTSNGLQGYGGSDLFMIRKMLNGQWGSPQNLGYPINTIENEGSLCVSADGLTAYYASDRSDTRGGLDLYKFDLRDDIKPYRTLYVKGKVFDVVTHKPLPSTVELIDNTNSNALMKIQTDERGEFFITLPTGKEYTFTVNRKGYLFYSQLYPLQKSLPDSTYAKDIALQPITLNANVRLANIQFESNSFKLQRVSLIELDKLVEILADNAKLSIEIGGHTDNTGNAADNIKLSASRAKAVVDYLISKGIPASRLTWKGYGATKPVADNTTEEGKAKNRRTEFRVTAL